jgi:hypothetical protein
MLEKIVDPQTPFAVTPTLVADQVYEVLRNAILTV